MSEDTKKDKGLTRRDFLKATGGAAVVAGIAIGGVTANPKDAQAAGSPMPKKWDETYDIVVIGSGFAGLAAAIEAKIAGASVVVIDKMPVHGGNSIINGGDFSDPEPRCRKQTV